MSIPKTIVEVTFFYTIYRGGNQYYGRHQLLDDDLQRLKAYIDNTGDTRVVGNDQLMLYIRANPDVDVDLDELNEKIKEVLATHGYSL